MRLLPSTQSGDTSDNDNYKNIMVGACSEKSSDSNSNNYGNVGADSKDSVDNASRD